jgi:hypothetical protein
MARSRTAVSTTRHLTVAKDTGEAVEAVPCPFCETGEEHPEHCELMRGMVAEIKSLARRLEQLRRDIAAEQRAAANRPLIEELHAYWQEQTGHPKKPLSSDRHKSIDDLLRLWSREQIMCMCVGLGQYPWEAYGERFAERPNAKAKERVEWDFIAAKAKRAELAGIMGAKWLKAQGLPLPAPRPEGEAPELRVVDGRP